MPVIYGCGKGRIHRNEQPTDKPSKPRNPKTCRSCGRVLPASEFSANSRIKDGLNNECKECANARRRADRARKKEAR